jgi:hypothetical protein
MRLSNGNALIILSRGDHTFPFIVARQLKAEMMRHVGEMAAKEEAGFDYIAADQVCMAIRSAFPEPLSHAEVLKLEWEQAKQKIQELKKKIL